MARPGTFASITAFGPAGKAARDSANCGFRRLHHFGVVWRITASAPADYPRHFQRPVKVIL
jgi:hypothetical protein